MAKVSVGIPQGTRDFGPDVVRKRNHIFQTIRSVFEVYGFQPLETPAMENLETLLGKYGEEGDKLIFKILNNGLDNPQKLNQVREDFEKLLQGKSVRGITERALRYDLTIPFARYVAMNHNNLVFPFKRYQLQPVWRADRPQKGRYREFYQCDADVVGSESLFNEVELAIIYASVFEKLGINVEIKLNSRKILAALADICEAGDKLTDITVAIDKLDKIGLDKVKEELLERGLHARQVNIIEAYLLVARNSTGNHTILDNLKNLLGNHPNGARGIDDLFFIVDTCGPIAPGSRIAIDPTLARGLNYYTGTIFEVKALDVSMGSIGGGGRYDDLTGLFGVPGVPGVGISFGVDRIYDVMDELQLFPEEVHTGTQVLFFNLGQQEAMTAFGLMQKLRSLDVRCELYHEPAKFDKQFKYGEKKKIPFAVIIGSKELAEKTCVIRDLRKGSQEVASQENLQGYSFV
jgi:histidyl-tRNA synthetase